MAREILCWAMLAMAASPSLSLKVDFSDLEWKMKPITKVVNLLKDMQAQLEVEAKQDEELYEQMGCWCETNEREKTKAIEFANQRIPDLESTIQSTAAKMAQLEVDIEQLTKETKKSKASLEKSTELRAKEQSEFR